MASRRGLLQRFVTPMVYFIQAGEGGLIKIGMTYDVADRMKTLQVGCPARLILLGVIQREDAAEQERSAHIYFKHLRVRGEWFTPAPELLEVIDKHAHAPPPSINYEMWRVMEAIAASEAAQAAGE